MLQTAPKIKMAVTHPNKTLICLHQLVKSRPKRSMGYCKSKLKQRGQVRQLLNYGMLGDGGEDRLQLPVAVAVPSRDGRDLAAGGDAH